MRWIAGWCQNDLVQLQLMTGLRSQNQMSYMNRIESASEYTNLLAS